MRAVSRPWAGIKGERHPAAKVSDQERAKAIERVGVYGECVKAVAMDLNVANETVAFWMRQAGWKRGYVRKS